MSFCLKSELKIIQEERMKKDGKQEIIDEKGRRIVVFKRRKWKIRYYEGYDGKGEIIKDTDNKEYIIVNGKKRYWIGEIKPLPNDKRLKNLKKFGFIIFKPEVQEKNIGSKIISIFKEKGFRVITKKYFRFNQELIIKLYPAFMDKNWKEELVAYLNSELSCCLLIHVPNDTIDEIKELSKIKQSIRKKWKIPKNAMKNIVHSPDSKENLIREALLFFKIEELVRLIGYKLK